MEDNNQSESVASTTVAETTPAVAAATGKGGMKRYLITAVVVVVIGLGLLFFLEREDRISTNFFSFLGGDESAAVVNGTVIAKSDFESSLNQLMQMAAAQGASTTDPVIIEQYRTQAVDTLINGELLRQAALAAGMTAPADAINSRFTEIETGLGGQEQLVAKMAEFGITEAVLRRDIENEILIQGLFDSKFPLNTTEVSEEEINALYAELGGEEAGLPPLSEVKEQVAEQIKLDRQQTQISEYIDTLRSEAKIEILI